MHILAVISSSSRLHTFPKAQEMDSSTGDLKRWAAAQSCARTSLGPSRSTRAFGINVLYHSRNVHSTCCCHQWPTILDLPIDNYVIANASSLFSPFPNVYKISLGSRCMSHEPIAPVHHMNQCHGHPTTFAQHVVINSRPFGNFETATMSTSMQLHRFQVPKCIDNWNTYRPHPFQNAQFVRFLW